MTEQMLTAAIEAGRLKAQPVRPLATVMIGALDEAAMSIADAADATAEREQVVHDLIAGRRRLTRRRKRSTSRSDRRGGRHCGRHYLTRARRSRLRRCSW
jgi:Tetracyclin repressor-like, C-terminal domain